MSRFLLVHDGHPMAGGLVQALARAGATPDLVNWRSAGQNELRATLQAAAEGVAQGGAASTQVVLLAGASLPMGAGIGRDCTPAAGGIAAVPWLEGLAETPLLALGRVSGWLAAALGAGEGPSLRPSHGHIVPVQHSSVGLLAGLPSPLPVMRYDSVLPRNLPPHLAAEAWSEEGDILAWRHRHRPWWGISFHPESLFAGASRDLLTHLVERGKEAFHAAP